MLPVLGHAILTHWGRVTHICVSQLTIIASDNGLLLGRHQAIIWTNDGILLIWPLGTNFNEILIEIHSFSFKKMDFKMSSGKWRPFCLGLNVLRLFYPLQSSKQQNIISSICGYTYLLIVFCCTHIIPSRQKAVSVTVWCVIRFFEN